MESAITKRLFARAIRAKIHQIVVTVSKVNWQ